MKKKQEKLPNMITRGMDYVSYHYMEDIKVEGSGEYLSYQ